VQEVFTMWHGVWTYEESGGGRSEGYEIAQLGCCFADAISGHGTKSMVGWKRWQT